MVSFARWFIVALALSIFVSGCYNRPVRHLASDAVLIKANQSTRQDVLTFLGDPDSRRMVDADLEEWVYYEEKRSMMQQTPVVGDYFDADGYGLIVVLLKGDRVVACKYSAYETDERKWADDYSWQEKNK